MKARHVLRIVSLMVTTGVLFDLAGWQFVGSAFALGVALFFGLLSFIIEATDRKF